MGHAWRSVVGFTRLAVYKDDYSDEHWVVPPEHGPVRQPDGSIP